MSTYVFIKGFVDTLDLFSDELICETISLGDKYLCINKDTQKKDIKKLRSIHDKEPIRAVITFNNLGYNIENEEGENLWDSLDISYVDILMDHPFHFCEKLKVLPENAILFCVDRAHVKFVETYFSNIKKVFFLPHGGCKNTIDDIGDGDNKEIDILYSGNLSRSFAENLIPDFEQFDYIDGARFSGEVLQFLVENPWITTEECLLRILKNNGIILGKDEELHFIDEFRFLEGFAVSYFRELSVRILVENGFIVTVLGSGWSDCEWANNSNLSLIGRVSPEKVFSYMKKSKIVLNTMTWFKDGVHDRIFNGQLSGAAVLSDGSRYLDEIYNNKEDFVCFDLSDMEELPYIADELVSKNEYRKYIIDSGYNKVCKSHTWKNRLGTILEKLG